MSTYHVVLKANLDTSPEDPEGRIDDYGHMELQLSVDVKAEGLSEVVARVADVLQATQASLRAHSEGETGHSAGGLDAKRRP